MVGTGGDGSGTFNISTAAAIVVAAAGVPVAKHGNRASPRRPARRDVLEALGVTVEQTPEAAAEALREDGFAFLFAPGFHPAMRHAGPTRREIGVRTAFNLIGPLTNPAGVRRQLLGVADPSVAATIAAVARELGTDRTFVVCGDHVDELPLDGSGVIYDVSAAGITRRDVTAADLRQLGLSVVPTEALRGGVAGRERAPHRGPARRRRGTAPGGGRPQRGRRAAGRRPRRHAPRRHPVAQPGPSTLGAAAALLARLRARRARGRGRGGRAHDRRRAARPRALGTAGSACSARSPPAPRRRRGRVRRRVVPGDATRRPREGAGPPVRGAAGGTGPAAHRRGQTCLTVGRPARAYGPRHRGPGPCLRRGRCNGHLGAL